MIDAAARDAQEHVAPTPRRGVWFAASASAAAAFAIAFAIVVWTLESASVTEVGGGFWGVAAIGAVVSLPLFGLASLVAASCVGMAVALVDRSFDFRSLAVITGCAIAAAVLATSIGAAMLMRTEVDATVVIACVTFAHLGIAFAYARALERLAGVRRRAAWGVGVVVALATTSASIVGVVVG